MKEKPKTHAPQIVAIEGGRKDKSKSQRTTDGHDEEYAVLTTPDEQLVLREFVLVGENSDGKRVLLTFNLSLDQFLAHAATITVVAHKRVEKVLEID